MDRLLNKLNEFRALGAAILGIAIAVAAFKAGGWQGWLVGGAFLVFAAYMVVASFRSPRYRPPQT